MPFDSNFIAINRARARVDVVQQYDVLAVRRFSLFPGQPTNGLYKSKLTDMAYEFTARPRANRNAPWVVFHTGERAAHSADDSFLKLLNVRSQPALFTWEKSGGAGGTTGVLPGGGAAELAPLNKELLELLNLFFTRAGFDPSKKSAAIFDGILRFPHNARPWDVKSLNTMLRSFRSRASDIVGWMEAARPGKVRTFSFPLARQVLIESNVPESDIFIDL